MGVLCVSLQFLTHLSSLFLSKLFVDRLRSSSLDDYRLRVPLHSERDTISLTRLAVGAERSPSTFKRRPARPADTPARRWDSSTGEKKPRDVAQLELDACVTWSPWPAALKMDSGRVLKQRSKPLRLRWKPFSYYLRLVFLWHSNLGSHNVLSLYRINQNIFHTSFSWFLRRLVLTLLDSISYLGMFDICISVPCMLAATMIPDTSCANFTRGRRMQCRCPTLLLRSICFWASRK